MEWIVAIVVIVGIAFYVAIDKLTTQTNEIIKKAIKMTDRLGQVEDFNPTQKYLGVNGESGIAIDEDRKKVAFLSLKTVPQNSPDSDQVAIRIINYEDLLSSEIFEDGIAVTKTSRTSQIGGAILGGIALGGVGAIIGGLSGETQSAPGKVRRLDLRITVNDTKSPLHDVCFLDATPGAVSKSDTSYPTIEKGIRHWHGLCAALIKQADRVASNSNNSTQNHPPSRLSITDELRNLSQLKTEGAISEEEFLELKRRIFS